MQNDIDGILATQNQFKDVLQRVQMKNDEKFFLLGNEIKDTQDSVFKITKLVGTQLKALENELISIKGVIANIPVCNQQLIHSMSFLQQIRDYIDHLGTLYAHIKSYRAAFYAYQIALYSTISSLAAGYVSPQFLLPSQLASIVNVLAHDWILRGIKLSPAIRVGQEAIYYELQMVLEVFLLPRGISVVLGVPMKSKRPFDVYPAIPLYQLNNDGGTASLYHFPKPLLAISTDNSRFAELDDASLQQCSGNNRIKLCRQGFLTTRDETLLCLPSSYYNYDIPALRNCKVESVLLPDAPQDFYLADGVYHFISRDPHIQMKNDSGSDFSISTLSCKACLIRPSCSSTLSFNQGDLEFRPDLDFCKTKPEPFLAKIQFTPSLDQIFQHVPRTTSNFHTYSVTEAGHSVLSSIRLELAELPNVKTMSSECLAELTRPIAQYYSSVSPATSAALSSYLPTRTAICFSVVSITISLLTFSISFTLFRRQWKRLFAHPQRFFRGTSGKFLHIVDAHPTSPDADSSFLYHSVQEFQALQALAHATLRDQSPPLVSTNPPAAALPTHPPTNYSHPNPPLTSVYPTVTVLLYSESSTSLVISSAYVIYLYLSLYLCICISISYSFSICSYVFSSHPERCLLTCFRVSFFLLPRLRERFGMFPCLGLAVRSAPTSYTVRHVSVSPCTSRLLLFLSYVSVCSPPFFPLSRSFFSVRRFITSFPNYVVSILVVSGLTSTSSATTLPAATLC